MKLIFTNVYSRVFSVSLFFTLVSLFFSPLAAQICADPGNTVYGLNSNGEIRPVTVSTAIVGSKITPNYSGSSASSSNGLGYNSLNGKFYYFKRNADKSPQQFVSFDPATNAVDILQSCPTTTTIHTGCVNAAGTGYYCTDVDARLYFYNIVSNTWTLITSTFFDDNGNNISSSLSGLTSGDIAIDGFGNLWFLCSGNNAYGLYKMNAPLPVTSVSSITAIEFISPTTPTPNGEAFAGAAFSPTGQMILTNRSGANKMYRLENDNSLTDLGTLSVSGIGNDLTSCNFPYGVLPVSWKSFSVVMNGSQLALLNWEVVSETGSKGYAVEHSTDGRTWEQLGFVAGTSVKNSAAHYSYQHKISNGNKHYYRIKQIDLSGSYSYSAIKVVTTDNAAVSLQVAVWPNPAQDVIRIQADYTGSGKAMLVDYAGRVVMQQNLSTGVNTMAIKQLPAGAYFVRVQWKDAGLQTTKIIKQ